LKHRMGMLKCFCLMEIPRPRGAAPLKPLCAIPHIQRAA